MSTSGSAPDAVAAPASALKTKGGGLLRWKGIIPLTILGILLVGGWKFFGARAIRAAITTGGSEVVGAQVDVADLSIHLMSPSIEIRGLAIADPDNLTKNMLEAGRVFIELEALPLFQKKVIVKRITVEDVQSGNTRAVPARPVERDTAAGLYAEAQKFSRQFKVPLLSLVPLDSMKALLLNPQDLKAVQAAVALAREADSVKQRLENGHASLNLQPTIDSSSALVARLQGVNVRTLGVEGARAAVADIRRVTAMVDSSKNRVNTLAADAKRSLESLEALSRAIDDARTEDYATARGLLRLPSFDAPEIGSALFGKAALARFEKAVYWASLARKYTPPGLLPKESAGPKRLRKSGTTLHFVEPTSYPRFLLRRADVNVKGAGATPFDYAVSAADITTDPAITKRPMLFVARRNSRAAADDSLRVSASLDHAGATPRDAMTAFMSGVRLPSIALPMLPYSLDPGRGVAELRLRLDGEQLSGSWSVQSSAITWPVDSARAKPLNAMESLVARAVTGIRDLQLTAELGGTLNAPTMSVRSNIDRVIAERLRAVAGQEIAAAEAKLRAQVDRLVEEKSAPVRARVAGVKADAEKRLADARTKLDEEKRKLEERLRALTAGVNLPRLPGRPPA